MAKPVSTATGAIFDIATIDAEMRREDAYRREGHTARTLVREPDLRIVLVVMRAGARIAEHQANGTTSVHTVGGHVRVRLPDKIADLPAGRLLVLEPGVRHDVEAVEASAFLLTLSWQGK